MQNVVAQAITKNAMVGNHGKIYVPHQKNIPVGAVAHPRAVVRWDYVKELQ